MTQCNTCPAHQETLTLRLLRACPMARRSMGVSEDDLIVLNSLQQSLRHGARRPFTLSGMNTPCATCDERCLLNILAAYQNDDMHRAENTLDWLVYPHARMEVQRALAKIASLLKGRGIVLKTMTSKAPARRETAGLYALIGSS